MGVVLWDDVAVGVVLCEAPVGVVLREAVGVVLCEAVGVVLWEEVAVGVVLVVEGGPNVVLEDAGMMMVVLAEGTVAVAGVVLEMGVVSVLILVVVLA